MAVLVTRPDERGGQLVNMLNKAGIVAIHLPLFSIEPGREINELPNKYKQLKSGDYIFAVSKNAVNYAVQTLKNTGSHWRSDLNYFTVGQRTAEYFASQTGQVILYPWQQENSEGVLSLPAMQKLNDKRILILRGNGGRELFPHKAHERGAEVDIVECYQRVPVNYNNEEQSSVCKRAGVNTIIVTSVEILTYLMDFVPKTDHNWLKNCRLITISRRIKQFALHFGWKNIVISPRADNQSLLQTLLQSE